MNLGRIAAVTAAFALGLFLGGSISGKAGQARAQTAAAAGAEILLEVAYTDYVQGMVVRLRDDVRRVLRTADVALSGGIGLENKGVAVEIADDAARARAQTSLREALARDGLAGSSAIEIEARPRGVIALRLSDAGIVAGIAQAADQSVDVLRSRLDSARLRAASVERRDHDRLFVRTPPVDDPKALAALLTTTGRLEVRFVAESGEADAERLYGPQGREPLPVLPGMVLTGTDIIDARPAFDRHTTEPVVNIRLSRQATATFAKATSENVGRILAIVFDGTVISAPRILQPITGGAVQISGTFTPQSANVLAVLLRSGSFPAKLNVLEVRDATPPR